MIGFHNMHYQTFSPHPPFIAPGGVLMSDLLKMGFRRGHPPLFSDSKTRSNPSVSTKLQRPFFVKVKAKGIWWLHLKKLSIRG